MATTLSAIRFLVEREVGVTLDDADILNWCNQVNMDVGININIQDTVQILLTTTGLEYLLPDDLKIINRLWLQSEFDAGIDKEFTLKYRTYAGKIILARPWIEEAALNIDYYRDMIYFTSIDDLIELDDRFTPLYVFYCKLTYHNQQKPMDNVNWRVAINSINVLQNGYNSMKNQVTSYYSLGNDPVVIDERW